LQPRLFRLFVFILALALSLALSCLAGLLAGISPFALSPAAYTLLAWGVCAPVIYVVLRFYNLPLGLAFGVVLGAGAAALWVRLLGDAEPVFVLFPLTFALLAVLFEFAWVRFSALRALIFGILSALTGTLAGLTAMLFTGGEFTAPALLESFRLCLFAGLAVSVALGVAERIYIPLAWRWAIPGRFTEEEEEPAPQDNEDEA